MSIHSLSVSKSQDAAQTPAARLDRLRAEFAEIAREHIAEFEKAIGVTVGLAQEISEGGEAYSVGAREVARRLSGQLIAASQTLETLRFRESH